MRIGLSHTSITYVYPINHHDHHTQPYLLRRGYAGQLADIGIAA